MFKRVCAGPYLQRVSRADNLQWHLCTGGLTLFLLAAAFVGPTILRLGLIAWGPPFQVPTSDGSESSPCLPSDSMRARTVGGFPLLLIRRVVKQLASSLQSRRSCPRSKIHLCLGRSPDPCR